MLNVSSTRDLFDDSSVTYQERSQHNKNQEKKEEDTREREKKSHFSRWSQYNLEHTRDLMNLALKHPKAHGILYFLVDQMDDYNAVMCSHKVLEEILGLSSSTVTRGVKALKDLGFISVLKSGTSNIYAINDNVYWKSWGNNRRYSKFPANVVLSESEQEKNFDVKHQKHKEITIPEK